MEDQTAGLGGVAIIVIIVLFVGFWFGWKFILWIIGAAVITLIVAAMFTGVTSK